MCMLNEAEITKLGSKEDIPVITLWQQTGLSGSWTTQYDFKHLVLWQSHFFSNTLCALSNFPR